MLARALNKSVGLRPGEWWLLAKSSVMLSALLCLQHLVSLPRLMVLFDAHPVKGDRGRMAPERLIYVVTGLMRVALSDSFCMKRSILLFHYLRKWGYDATIYFGVTKREGVLHGHAWVDLNGAPLAESGNPHHTFAVMYAYPRSAALSARE